MDQQPNQPQGFDPSGSQPIPPEGQPSQPPQNGQPQGTPPQNGQAPYQPPYQAPPPGNPQQPYQGGQTGGPPYQQPYQAPYQQPYQQGYYAPGTDNGTVKALSVLAYIPLLFLVGLFLEKDNEDVKFHVNQGLILFILEAILGVARSFLSWLPFIGWMVNIAFGVLSLGTLALMIVGIVNAAQGRRRPLPVIGTLFTFVK